ncbi:hypothetical protein ACHAQA_000117 [Verticillium albo-atrum]
MPSLTSLSQYSLINVGPLTTTWTAPASCTAGPSVKYIAPVSPSDFGLWGSNCSTDLNNFVNCIPQAEEIKSLWEIKDASPPVAPNPLVYHSPGTICPSGWTTVGVATKSSNGDIDASGHFTQAKAAFQGTGTRIAVGQAIQTNPRANILLEALTPGESIVLCCPSGYETSIYGLCYRNFPLSEFPGTTGCQNMLGSKPRGRLITVTFTYDGELVTGYDITQTNTALESISRYIETTALSLLTDESQETSAAGQRFDWPPAGPYTGYEQQVMVTLINGASDASESAGSAGSTGSTGSTGSNEEEGEPTETGESAARSGKMPFGAGAGADTLLAAWGVAALMGVALMMT